MTVTPAIFYGAADNPHFVDFDDARMAPAIQDLWMLLSGNRQEQTAQMTQLVKGYSEFYHFNVRELALIEVFRSLRIMHHSAWIARRWDDPAFPMLFRGSVQPAIGASIFWCCANSLQH